MPVGDPKKVVFDLIKNNWNSANTNGVTPRFEMGWYNEGWQATPQVTFSDPIYVVRQGGETGVTAIGPGGTNVRVMVVELTISCWSHHDMELPVNPRVYNFNAALEVRRIIEANYDQLTDVDWINWVGMNEIVEAKIKPVWFRYSNRIRLVYRESF